MVGSKKFNVFSNFLGGAMLTAVQTYNISSCIPHPHVIAKWALDPMDLSGPIFSRIYGYNNPAIGWIKLYYYEIRDKWFGVDGICTVERCEGNFSVTVFLIWKWNAFHGRWQPLFRFEASRSAFWRRKDQIIALWYNKAERVEAFLSFFKKKKTTFS